jgi:hypothetical protein
MKKYCHLTRYMFTIFGPITVTCESLYLLFEERKRDERLRKVLRQQKNSITTKKRKKE